MQSHDILKEVWFGLLMTGQLLASIGIMVVGGART
jgi:hypothetical protein